MKPKTNRKRKISGVAIAERIKRHREADDRVARKLAEDGKKDTSQLLRMTGKTRLEWVGIIQTAIRRHSRPSSDPDHSETNALKWVHDLAKEVQATAPKKGQYDENMRLASIIALALTYWFSRVQRAKAYDPRRPVVLRRAALQRWHDFWRDMLDGAIFEAEDAELFPGQHWDPPWSEHAIDGHFR